MKFIAKTLFGIEEVLAAELRSIGASDVEVANRAVHFTGNRDLMYHVNYCSRTALSVLVPIAEFRIRSTDDLYKSGLRIEWDRYLDPYHTFSIVPVVNSPLFRHTGYAGLVLKDSIADWFRKATGRRPSVDTNDPDIVFNLHISNDQVSVSLDSSVIPLYKRGYRKEQGIAPINEVLAAALILYSGWNSEFSLLDPMCGSGTIPIEAALIASCTPPGKFRQYYGFQRWKDFDENAFKKVKEDCDSKICAPEVHITGNDISEEAVMNARKNISSAGMTDFITIENNNFADMKAGGEEGFIIMNPPYGQRIKPSESGQLYNMIGTTFKHGFPGYKAFLITSDKESLKQVGLKPSSKMALYNGSLECVLVRYDLYQGSKKR